MRAQKSKLAQFMRLGGYGTVRQIKRGSFEGHWRNLSEASRKTGISRHIQFSNFFSFHIMIVHNFGFTSHTFFPYYDKKCTHFDEK